MERILLSLLLAWISTTIQATTFDIRQHFATKTPYNVRPAIHDSHHHPEYSPQPDWECTPIHLFMVTRHGSRYPTKKYMDKFRKLQTKLNAIQFENSPKWLKDWVAPFDNIDDGLLTRAGVNELFQLGQRTRSRFNQLFNETYNPYRYAFRATQVHRALQSGSAFAHGLFHDESSTEWRGMLPLAMQSESKHLDVHLRFHKLCPKYIQEIKKNDTIREQGSIAKAITDIHNNVAKRVGERLGFPKDSSFSTTNTKLLWNACKMEATVFEMQNQTCSLFDRQDALELELADDADDYWFKGHGFSINHSMACKLVSSIVQTMKDKSTQTELTERAKFWFAHAETVIPLLASLGLYDAGPRWTCNPDTHEINFQTGDTEGSCELPISFDEERPWRSSSIAPFAANVGFVLHSCKKVPINGAGYYVQVLHNEQTVVLPESVCGGKWLCPLQEFEDGMPHSACDFEEMCEKSKNEL